MKKILFMTDGFRSPTGFGTVAANLISRLNKEFECAILSWQYIGNKYHDIEFDCDVYPVSNHSYGKDTLSYVLAEFKPDIFITIGDGYMLNYICDVRFQKLLKDVKWISYLPIDGDVIPMQYEEFLEFPNVIVTMAKHGQKVLDKLGIRNVYIPHGIDTSVYKPMDKDKLKEEYGYSKDTFIYGCVARNQDRKQLQRLVRAFSLLKDKSNKILHFHNDPLDPANMFKDSNNNMYSVLMQAICYYGVKDYVYFSKGVRDFINGINTQEMAKTYNMFDVHCLPTGGEGFGLPIVESLACGIPQIITDFTTAEELVGDDRGIRVPAITHIFVPHGSLKALIDEEKMSEAMQQLYDNDVLRKQMGENAAKFALGYDWNNTIVEWKKLLNE